MEQQLKELTSDYETTKKKNESLEIELNAAVSKVWTLRERNQELESKLAYASESAENLSVKLKEKENELTQSQQEYQNILQEFDSMRDTGVKELETLHEQHETSSALIKQMKTKLMEVEKTVISRIRELENSYLSVSSSKCIYQLEKV